MTTAILSINPDTGKISDYAYGIAGEGNSAPATSSYFFYEFCYPPTGGETPESGGTTVGTFDVGVDGALTGECTRTARGGTANRKSTLTGQWDKASGTVTFHMEGQSVNTDPQRVLTYTLVVDGPAVSLEGDTARSNAPFSFTCTSSSAANPCPFTKISGTLDAAVIFPELTGAADSSEPAPAAGSTSGGGGDSKAGLVGLAAIAAGIAAAGFAWSRRGRRKDGGMDGEQLVKVISDGSGGYEDGLSYGEGAGSAAPAAPKAYEALVVGQSQQSSKDEPLTNDDEKKAADEARDGERESKSDSEGR